MKCLNHQFCLKGPADTILLYNSEKLFFLTENPIITKMLEYDEAVAAAGGSRENQEYKYREEIGGHLKRYSIPMLIITIFGIGAGVASLFLIDTGSKKSLYNANGIWGSVCGLLGAIIGIILSSWNRMLFGKSFSCFFGLFFVTVSPRQSFAKGCPKIFHSKI